jgi:hypothetical protein
MQWGERRGTKSRAVERRRYGQVLWGLEPGGDAVIDRLPRSDKAVGGDLRRHRLVRTMAITDK